MDNQQGHIAQYTELYSMLCHSLDDRKGLGVNGYMCIYGRVTSLFT